VLGIVAMFAFAAESGVAADRERQTLMQVRDS